MATAIGSIVRAAARRPDEPLNILTAPTHERTESNLCKTGHRFWAIRGPQVKDWNAAYAACPENYVLLNPARGDRQLPPEVDFDLVFSQNKFGQFQILSLIAKRLHLPLLSLEHTLVHPSWSQSQLGALKGMRGDVNVFISEYSRKAWNWADNEAVVVHHGVDTECFTPDVGAARKSHVLSVVNQLRERDWCCGYQFWEEATRALPRVHLGESPDGWSTAAKNVTDLVRHYQEAAAFVDTASASPIPTVVLEAMSCGCVVVSRGNAMLPEVIQHGLNGFICPDAASMRAQLKDVLARPDHYDFVRENARRTITERFSLGNFVRNWDLVFRQTAGMAFTGE